MSGEMKTNPGSGRIWNLPAMAVPWSRRQCFAEHLEHSLGSLQVNSILQILAMIKLHGVAFIFALKNKTGVFGPGFGLGAWLLVNIPAYWLVTSPAEQKQRN